MYLMTSEPLLKLHAEKEMKHIYWIAPVLFGVLDAFTYIVSFKMTLNGSICPQEEDAVNWQKGQVEYFSSRFLFDGSNDFHLGLTVFFLVANHSDERQY